MASNKSQGATQAKLICRWPDGKFKAQPCIGWGMAPNKELEKTPRRSLPAPCLLMGATTGDRPRGMQFLDLSVLLWNPWPFHCPGWGRFLQWDIAAQFRYLNTSKSQDHNSSLLPSFPRAINSLHLSKMVVEILGLLLQSRQCRLSATRQALARPAPARPALAQPALPRLEDSAGRG